MGKSKTQSPPDQAQRDLILTRLDQTMLVEAAAGTGKTTSMVGRMTALLAEGRCQIQTLAAVTFTRKAADELRARFRLELERKARCADGPARDRLLTALAHIEQCFIGTIHSFCSRLLRERPVEAGVDLAFEEADEVADARLRKEAWDSFSAELLAAGDPLLDELEACGLDLSDLSDCFMSFANYPDVREWPAEDVTMPDLAPVREALRDYEKHLAALIAALDLAAVLDNKFVSRTLKVLRMLRQGPIEQPAGLMDVLSQYEASNAKIAVRSWPLGEDNAKEENERWAQFRTNYALPILATWRTYRYARVLRVLTRAMTHYDALRHARGVLNYQDLLMKAAGLLRAQPHVRHYFRGRFTHLLVDEFQDTDPIQAEVMLLLTAQSETQTDWRKCAPVPGSLFVVGDPKQSIYRFRRADIVTYNQVREVIEASGGQVLTLSANFRTTAPLIAWVNETFKNEFPASADEFSPAWVELAPGRGGAVLGDLSGLRVLQIPDDLSGGDEIVEYEAGLIARTIRDALDRGLTLPRSPREIQSGVSPAAQPGDFMIVTRRRNYLHVYARELQRLGIPHQVTGGAGLCQAEPLALLQLALAAATQPENPVALVAALRGELFGLSDTDLYAYKKAGGRFSFNAPVPPGLTRTQTEAFEKALGMLKIFSRWLASMPPAAAIERISTELGLFAMAAASSGGSDRAGALAKTIELVRQAQAGTWSVADLAEYLGELASGEEGHDGMPARPHERPVVRLMNLHKVKGLEAPVVFLAGPVGKSSHDVGLHVDRAQEQTRGHLAVYGKANGYVRPVLAHPQDWQALSGREQQFLDAEEMRLLYVAATRAGAQLVITRRDKYPNRNPWAFFNERLEGLPALGDPAHAIAPVQPLTGIKADEAAESVKEIQTRWETVARPTYENLAAKQVLEGKTKPRTGGREHGGEWGTVIHVLLEVALRQPGADLVKFAEAALEQQELNRAQAGEAVATVRSVMGSPIMQRALASPRRFIELPFECLDPRLNATKDRSAPPVIIRGVMDLIFEEGGGWVIVDYKTDTAAADALPELARYYAPQVDIYADAWHAMTGLTVSERGFYFTHAGHYLTL